MRGSGTSVCQHSTFAVMSSLFFFFTYNGPRCNNKRKYNSARRNNARRHRGIYSRKLVSLNFESSLQHRRRFISFKTMRFYSRMRGVVRMYLVSRRDDVKSMTRKTYSASPETLKPFDTVLKSAECVGESFHPFKRYLSRADR